MGRLEEGNEEWAAKAIEDWMEAVIRSSCRWRCCREAGVSLEARLALVTRDLIRGRKGVSDLVSLRR